MAEKRGKSNNVKAVFIRGLMKVGLFQPDIPRQTISPSPGSSSIAAARVSTADGTEVSLGDLRGKVVFLNFWATWCPPCIAEMPSINQLYQQFRTNKDVVFLMVDVDRRREKSQAFLDKNNYNMPLAVPSGAIPKELFAGSLPTTVILDKSGNIVMSHEGAADYSSAKMTEFMKNLVEAK